jgi:predicted nuclease of predicted toxin-antitoxin system
MDHQVQRAIVSGLRVRGVDVLTAYEDNAHQLSDPELLDRATVLGRVLFSRDDDLLVEASRRQRVGMVFSGVIYAHQLKVSIGDCIRDLELIAQAATADELSGQILFLPV